MKTILVTGGAGFIGSHFVKMMLRKHTEIKIINLDLLTYAGNLSYLKELEDHEQYEFVHGDILDHELVQLLFKRFEIQQVVHFAAESHVDRSILDPYTFIRTNVLGTHVLLECAKSSWTIGTNQPGYPIFKEGVKFLQVSTDEVYGALGKEGYFTETTPLSPNSPYSASKASADHLVHSYYVTYQMPVNITRCSNNYGPCQYPEKLIPYMIKRTLGQKPLTLYGDGLQIRDWLYVEDHCNGIEMVLRNGRMGEVYNIGGNNERTNLEIVKFILSNLGESEELITYIEDRLGHDRRYAIDSSKIKLELGWTPTVPFDVGMSNTIQWYLANPWIFENPTA